MCADDEGYMAGCISDLGLANSPSIVAGQAPLERMDADFADACIATSPVGTVGYRAPEAVIAQTYAHGPVRTRWMCSQSVA